EKILMRDMITRSRILLLVAVIAGGVIVNNSSIMHGQAYADRMSALPAAGLPAEPNPLLGNWEGPYGGVPPFDRVQVALFKPALEAAMTQNLSEIDRIANDPAAPTFENTIVAMERAGKTLNRVGTLYGVWGSTMAGPEFQVVQREMAPKL